MSFPALTTTARELLLPAFAVLLTFARVEAAEHEPPRQIPSSDKVPEGLSASDWQGIHAAYESGRHRFQPVADGWLARNPGQQWTTHFDRKGFTAEPQDAGWTWGLQLESYGFGEAQTAVGGTPEVQADGQRLSYRWDATVEEWFINDTRGLEHGFTVAHRPPSGTTGEPSGLSFTLTTRGDLTPEVGPLAVAFHDASGATVLNYSGLKVWDADGTILASRFEPAGGKSFRLVVDERGARYPITIDPIAQQAYLKGDNGSDGFGFGISVAASGNTVVVGTPREGAVYIFTLSSSGVWGKQARLVASNPGIAEYFGQSVAISGDTVVVGTSFESSSATGVNGNQTDNSTPGAGAAYIFTRNSGVWSQQAYLKASNTESNDYFGGSVSISGNTVVVGAEGEDAASIGINGNQADNSTVDSGAAYVFVRTGSNWIQQAYLKASNVDSYDEFGSSVGISNETVVIGAPYESSSDTGVNGSGTNNHASDSGAAYVFVRSGNTWSQQAFLKASNTGVGDDFGTMVAISNDTIVVSAPDEDSEDNGVNGLQGNDNLLDSGAVYVFVRNGSNWSQQAYLKASHSEEDDKFGLGLAISGDTVVVGAPEESRAAIGVDGAQAGYAYSSGAAFVFARNGSTWSQQSYLKASNTDAYDNFGNTVAIAGNLITVGASGENSSATGINGDQADNSGVNSGAVYTFGIVPTVTASTASLANGGATLTIAGTGFSPIPGENTVTFTPGGTGIVTASTSTSLTVTGITGVSLGALHAVVATNFIGSGEPVQVATVVANSVPSDIVSITGPGSPVVWGAVEDFNNSPTQVNTAGVHHAAVRFGATDLVVNGVTFSRHIGGGIFATGSLITTTSPSSVDSLGSVASLGSGGSGNYGALVSTGGYQNNTISPNLTISGLTVGRLYQVQLFMPYWDTVWPTLFGSAGGSTVVLHTGITTSPKIVTGRFRATDSRQVVTWSRVPPNSWALLAAVSVRDIDGDGFAFAENNEPSATVATLAALDADAGQSHTFSLVAGAGDADNGSFTIVGNSLKLIPVADYETKGSYSIRVKVTDGGGGTFSEAIVLTVLDVPEMPEILVEEPVANGLMSGNASISFGGRPTGNSSSVRTFTIRNTGNAGLTLAAPVVSGGNADDFAVNNAGLITSVLPGGQTTFSVVFTPGGGGPRSATLGIGSNDADEPTFTIILTGTGLLQSNDTDSDGLNDVAEFNLSALGYDWQTSQPALVTALHSGASSADLFTPSQVQALNVGTPLLTRNPATGEFTLTLGIEKSTTLQGGSFLPIPFTPGGTTINGAGEIELQFTSPDNAAFFRVQAK